MVRSLLGDLIAKTAAAAKEPATSVTAPEEGKSATKRKRTVKFASGFDKTKGGDDDDDDSLYREEVPGQNSASNDGGEVAAAAAAVDPPSLRRAIDDTPATSTKEREESTSSYNHASAQEYDKAFSAIYGTSGMPTVATLERLTTNNRAPEQLLPPPPPPPNARKYQTPSQREQPQTRKRKHPKTKQWEEVVETPEQIQARVQQQARAQERLGVEARWKRRPYDLRAETDFGKAVYRRAKRQLTCQIQAEVLQRRKQEQEVAAQLVQLQHHQKASDQDEESVQEQQQLLNRLTFRPPATPTEESLSQSWTTKTTAGRQPHPAGGAATSSIGTTTTGLDPSSWWTQGDLSIPYKDRMDYWDYGWTVPPTQEEGRIVLPPDLTPRLLPGQNLQDADVVVERHKTSQSSNQRRPLRIHQRRLPFAMHPQELQIGMPWRPTSLPNPTHTMGMGVSRYFHYRQVQAMAVRYLCGTNYDKTNSSTHIKTQNRFLRLLFAPLVHDSQRALTLAQFTEARTLLRLSHQLGVNAALYARHTWSDAAQVAYELGLDADPNLWAGRLQNPTVLLQFMARQRHKVLKEYRVGSRGPWAPPMTNSPEENLVNLNRATEENLPNPGGQREGVDTLGKVEMTEDEANQGREDDTARNEISDTLPQPTAASDQALNHISTQPIAEGEEEMSKGDGTSAGGVIINTQNHAISTTTKEPIYAENTNTQSAILEGLFVPSTPFANIPGTSPPAPQLPLDVVPIIYGPPDRYAKYHHQDNYIHKEHLQLALSTFLSRLILQGGGEEDGDSSRHRQQILENQKRIQTLLEDYVELTDTKGYKSQLVFSRGKVQDVPLAQLYHAIQIYCSYWANGFPICDKANMHPVATKDEDETTMGLNDSDDLYTTNASLEPKPIQEVARDIYVFLDNMLQHNGLGRFVRPRVTLALAFVCHKIPAGAAKILAQPLDEDKSLTPIHLIRETCEYLEQKGLIRGSQGDDYEEMENEAMRDGELEYIFFEAAKKLESAVRIAPTDINCHLWRIGMLAACLLLSSGNRIGSKAHRFSSYHSFRVFESAAGQEDNISLDHEVRAKLPKFDDISLKLSSALEEFFALARHQPGEMIHRAVLSILDWHQVVAILAGDTLDTSMEDILKLYQHHAFQRYLNDGSDSARKSTAAASPSTSKSICAMAIELERDPSEIGNWRNLVDALGPIGIHPDHDGNDIEYEEHVKSCLDCQFTRRPRVFDHAHRHHHREKNDPKWWGHDRQWWASFILKVESAAQRHGPMVGEVVRSLEAADLPFQFQHDDASSSVAAFASPNKPEEKTYVRWLPTHNTQELTPRTGTRPTAKERSIAYDDRLPPYHHEKVFHGEDDENVSSHGMSAQLQSSCSSPNVQVLCYKLLISCHLFGPKNVPAQKSLLELCLQAYKKGLTTPSLPDKHNAEWWGLAWLYATARLDIPRIARHEYGVALDKPVKRKAS